MCMLEVLLAEGEDGSAHSALINAACPRGLQEKEPLRPLEKAMAWVSRELRALLFCDSRRNHELASPSSPPPTTLKQGHTHHLLAFRNCGSS